MSLRSGMINKNPKKKKEDKKANINVPYKTGKGWVCPSCGNYNLINPCWTCKKKKPEN